MGKQQGRKRENELVSHTAEFSKILNSVTEAIHIYLKFKMI